MSEPCSLTELVQQKEKEWKEAQELRVKSLESALQEKERQLSNERLRFKKLREDFEYNLKLVEDRDGELRRYDALFLEVKNIHSSRDGEVSELKIQVDDLKVKLHHELKTREELQMHYQQVYGPSSIEHFHVTSLSPCWRAKTIHFLSSGK